MFPTTDYRLRITDHSSLVFREALLRLIRHLWLCVGERDFAAFGVFLGFQIANLGFALGF